MTERKPSKTLEQNDKKSWLQTVRLSAGDTRMSIFKRHATSNPD
jgi:hypothetical protein